MTNTEACTCLWSAVGVVDVNAACRIHGRYRPAQTQAAVANEPPVPATLSPSAPKPPTTHLWPDCAGIAIGDVVEPNCGGPKMIVVDLYADGSGGIDGRVTTAVVRWVNEQASVPVCGFSAPVACFRKVKP